MRLLPCLIFLVACTDPDTVTVELAPNVVSSIDGTLAVSATVTGDRQIMSGEDVSVTVAYTDRNGTMHEIAGIAGSTNDLGVFEGTVSGLMWDGIGTVTAAVGSVEGKATFSVLDRTPPAVSIMAPATVKIGNSVKVTVHATDEIGISQLYFGSGDGQFARDRTTIVSGNADTTVSFDFQPQDVQAGQTVALHALAADLSGNLAAAAQVTIMVTP